MPVVIEHQPRDIVELPRIQIGRPRKRVRISRRKQRGIAPVTTISQIRYR